MQIDEIINPTFSKIKQLMPLSKPFKSTPARVLLVVTDERYSETPTVSLRVYDEKGAPLASYEFWPSQLEWDARLLAANEDPELVRAALQPRDTLRLHVLVVDEDVVSLQAL